MSGCEECGSPTRVHRGRQNRYCGKACTSKAAHRRQRERDPEYDARTKRQRREARKAGTFHYLTDAAGPEETLVCESSACGMEFRWARRMGRRPRFCSEDCAKRRLVRCGYCRTEFVSTGHAESPCCPDCLSLAQRSARGSCAVALYDPAFAEWQRARLAEAESRKAARAEAKRLEREERIRRAMEGGRRTGVCEECGEAWERAWCWSEAKYCSDRCAKRAASNRRRARKYGVAYEPLSWRTLWAEGLRECYLCGAECDPEDFARVTGRDGRRAVVVGPSHPTLEHLTPLARQGGHVRSNVDLACFSCNVAKGTLTAEEVAAA